MKNIVSTTNKTTKTVKTNKTTNINIMANLTTPKYIIKESEASLHITAGNSKVGKTIYGFSTLPGNKEHLLVLNHSILLTNIPGTCSKYCTNCAKDGACYAWRDAKLHNNVTIRAWGDNTLLLRNGTVFGLIEEYITKQNKKYFTSNGEKPAKINTFRINVSGEIENVVQLIGWNEIAKKHPEVNFGLYTKNYDALEEFMEACGDTEPNFVINVSQWHGCADDFLKKYAGKFNVFEYDDSFKKSKAGSKKKKKGDSNPTGDTAGSGAGSGLTEEQIARLRALPHCPAVDARGKHVKNADGTNKTCDKCKLCYMKRSGKAQTIAVYAH